MSKSVYEINIKGHCSLIHVYHVFKKVIPLIWLFSYRFYVTFVPGSTCLLIIGNSFSFVLELPGQTAKKTSFL